MNNGYPMNSIFLSSITNSRAAYEPFIGASGYGTTFSVFSHNQEEIQSSSVTMSGFLWLQTLARMVYENSSTGSQNEIKENEFHQRTAQTQRSHDLVQLLRSWREGDEPEQQNT